MFSFKEVKISIGSCVGENNLFYLDECGVLFENKIRLFQVSVDKDNYSLFLVGNYVVVDNMYGKVVVFDKDNEMIRFQNSIDECECYTGNFVSLYSSAAIRIRKVLAGESQEFVYVLNGELTLYYGDEIHQLSAGMCMGFQANENKGHRLVNHTDSEASFMVIGSRVDGDNVSYDKDDFSWQVQANGDWLPAHKDGTLYEPE